MSEDRLWAELNVCGMDYQAGDLLDYEAVVTRVALARRNDRMTAGDRWIETPDGLAKCPRCEQKARTA